MHIDLSNVNINSIVAIVLSVFTMFGGVTGAVLGWFKFRGKNSPKAQALLMWINDLANKIAEYETDANHSDKNSEAGKVLLDKITKLKADYNAKVNEYNIVCKKKVLDTKH